MYSTSKTTTPPLAQREKPSLLRRSLTLMKPITWFGPMWAFLCGTIASGGVSWTALDISRVLLGIVMAGPVLCGLSQVINDYFDQEVDAVNEPKRLIPAGLISTPQIFATFVILLALGISLGVYLGQNVALLVLFGVFLAFAYSAPPFRAKRNGWIGNSLVALSYEGLAWMAGHLVFAALTPPSIIIALLYSFGSHGIMSINDFKSIAGDKAYGIRTIPVMYGPRRAAQLIVLMMDLAQVGVIVALLSWGLWGSAVVITLLLLIQLPFQRHFIQQPVERHLKFSAIGVSFFVWGMMAAAITIRTLS